MADGKQRKGREDRRASQDREEADAVLLKALSHPVRARALTALNQRLASPSELAEEQGEAVGYVAYHVRVLHELGMIEQVKTRQVRGATSTSTAAQPTPTATSATSASTSTGRVGARRWRCSAPASKA